MTDCTLTRRQLLRHGTLLPLVSLPLLHGCGSAFTECADPNVLSRGAEQMRKVRQYAEISPLEHQNCASCEFFRGHQGEECGVCDILDGPVNQSGHCTSWAELG